MENGIKKTDEQTVQKKFFGIRITIRELIFIIAIIFSLSPFASPPIALLLGLFIALFIGNPFKHLSHKATHILLQISVVGLGFGMNVTSAINAGKTGVLFTVFSIIGTLVIGFLLSKIFKVEKKTSYLISSGTAICGGSAIAAISPVIKAEEKQISVALGTIFILNSIALFIFPVIGHKLNLSQTQFGLWCAIAIHDTSSVVGAACKYGNTALEVATTVKLTRALWIIPIAFLSTFIFKNKKSKIKIPYFIGLFIIAMFLNSYFPFIQQYNYIIVNIAKAGLTLTLFLIGSGLSKTILKSVGFRPLLQGVTLWIIISIVSLVVINFI
ncbi:MAG: putative sulfate exporter family transporter [Bacteroidales bacterium]|jgi:uncharacterized integral membrane protein (TIGR00698 family)|nr:putative sulfate exporter family transporter [Bacteroidales bacterium]